MANLYYLFFLSPLVLFLLLFIALKIVNKITFKSYHQVTFNDPQKIVIPPNQIKVLQYNAYWRPKLIHMGHEEFVGERSKLLSESLDLFDIISLNESFHYGSFVASRFINIMSVHGFNYVATSRPLSWFSKRIIDSGVMILSRYPIVEYDDVIYKDGRSYDDCDSASYSCRCGIASSIRGL